MTFTPDTSLARGGLFKNLPEHERVDYRAWAEAEFERDPEQPVKRVWHPVCRARWAELLAEQTRAELDIVDQFPPALPFAATASELSDS